MRRAPKQSKTRPNSTVRAGGVRRASSSEPRAARNTSLYTYTCVGVAISSNASATIRHGLEPRGARRRIRLRKKTGKSQRNQFPTKKHGGAEGNRTPDLCSAIAALSHLSYGPGQFGGIYRATPNLVKERAESPARPSGRACEVLPSEVT